MIKNPNLQVELNPRQPGNKFPHASRDPLEAKTNEASRVFK